MIDLLIFINILRSTDKYIETIYMNGGCYKFYLMLNIIFKGGIPYINKEKTHIVTKYYNKYYDITGVVTGNWYTPMTKKEKDVASKWSFGKNNMIKLSECPFCEEPITIK